MKDYIERFEDERMTYYRETYKNSPQWQGEKLNGEKIIVYFEQGIGDQIMFLRFLRLLDAEVIVHAHKDLKRIVKSMGYQFLSKDDPNLPEHELHTCSLSLPFLLKKPIPLEPYINIITKKELPEGKNIGIAWEGSPEHDNNKTRSCMLKFFKPLLSIAKMYHLQPQIQDASFIKDAEDMELYGIDDFVDWYDTAELINAVDYVVTVDTGVLHLAGAMGKKTIALLGTGPYDSRWEHMWYPTVKFIKGSWEECIEKTLSLIHPISDDV